MAFDYFYGRQAEQYQFYRIPKLLITDGRFSNISADAKLLYGLMLDRAALSAQNGWFDEENRVYIIYTVTQIMADLHCANQKAAKLLKELEGKNAGLIQRKRQGLGKPDLIYVMNFASDINDPEMPSDNPEKPDSDGTSPDVWKSHFQTCENHTSGDVNITSAEMWKSHGNNTDIKQTDSNQTDPIHLSAEAVDNHPAPVEKDDGMDEMDRRQKYKKFFEKKLDVESLKTYYKWETGRIDEIVDLMVEVMCSHAKTIRIGGEDRPLAVVQSRFMKLDYNHALYLMECMDENVADVRNIKAYMLTALYNAPITIDSYYRAKVNHDMFGYDANQGGG